MALVACTLEGRTLCCVMEVSAVISENISMSIYGNLGDQADDNVLGEFLNLSK